MISSESILFDNTSMRENSEVLSWFFSAKYGDHYGIETIAKEKFLLFKSELIHDIIHDTPENILPRIWRDKMYEKKTKQVSFDENLRRHIFASA